MAVIKRMMMCRRKAGTSLEQFMEYYETKHATLSASLFPMFASYKRNFIQPNPSRLPAGATDNPYDVVTEMVFANEADYAAFLAKIQLPEVRAVLVPDEAAFIEPGSIFSFAVRESVLPK